MAGTKNTYTLGSTLEKSLLPAFPFNFQIYLGQNAPQSQHLDHNEFLVKNFKYQKVS